MKGLTEKSGGIHVTESQPSVIGARSALGLKQVCNGNLGIWFVRRTAGAHDLTVLTTNLRHFGSLAVPAHNLLDALPEH